MLKYILKPLFLVSCIFLGPAFTSDLLAGTPWPTTQFKIDFSDFTNRESAGLATRPIFSDPDRLTSPASTANIGSAEEQANRALSYDVLTMFIENSLQEMAITLEQLGFRPPSLPLYDDGANVYFKMNIFDLPRDEKTCKFAGGYYHAGTPCGNTGISKEARFAFNSQLFIPLTPSWEAMLYSVLAHELFHAVQESYVETSNTLSVCTSGTKDYLAVTEGSADAIAAILTRKWSPDFYLKYQETWRPDALTDKEKAERTCIKIEEGEKRPIDIWQFYGNEGKANTRWLGWRPYTMPFLDVSTINHKIYRLAVYEASSFWLNLLDRYGAGFLHHLFQQALAGDDRKALSEWLDRSLRSYKPKLEGLYSVFPHFVTEFASQAGSKIPLEELAGSMKNKTAGQLILDPSKAPRVAASAASTDSEIRKWWIEGILGECESVKLIEGEIDEALLFINLKRLSAACINISWQDFENSFELQIEAAHDDLRLVDQLHLGLAYEKTENGENHCYTQVRPHYSEPLWTCTHEKPFTKPGPGNQGYVRDWGEVGTHLKGSGQRIYVLSNVALNAEKTVQTRESDPLMLRIGIFEAEGTDGREYDPPSTGPMGIGSVSAGSETLYGIARNPLPASTRLNFHIPVKDSDLAYGVHWMGESPALNYKGPYKGTVSGPYSGKSAISSSFCSRHANGVVGQVTRFDRDHLWVDIDADLCEMTIPPPSDGRFPKVDELKVSLRIPFGWRYSAESSPVDIVTPGMQVYIDRHAKRVPLVLSGAWNSTGAPGSEAAGQSTDGPPGPNSGTAPGQGGSSSGGSLCDCSCEEYKAMKESGESAKAEGDQDTMMKLSGQMMACMSQCQQKYMICLLDS